MTVFILRVVFSADTAHLEFSGSLATCSMFRDGCLRDYYFYYKMSNDRDVKPRSDDPLSSRVLPRESTSRARAALGPGARLTDGEIAKFLDVKERSHLRTTNKETSRSHFDVADFILHGGSGPRIKLYSDFRRQGKKVIGDVAFQQPVGYIAIPENRESYLLISGPLASGTQEKVR